MTEEKKGKEYILYDFTHVKCLQRKKVDSLLFGKGHAVSCWDDNTVLTLDSS